MNINLREEETNNYIALYRNYLEAIQGLNLKVTEVLNEVMEQSRYDKLQNLISKIIDNYTETIVNNIETGVFSTWEESGASLRACLRMYHAGDAADEACTQIEQQMNDLMVDTLRIEKGQVIITERPVVSEDGLERLEDICRLAQTELIDLKSEYIAQADSETDNNDIYGTLKPLIEGISSNMEAFFEASLNSFTQLHEFISGISAKLHNIAEENGVGVSDDSSADMKLSNGSSGIAQAMADKELDFSGEKFSDENIRLCVIVVEKIVNQVGVNELNQSVGKHYESLANSRNRYSGRAGHGNKKVHSTAKSTYGRYTVTNQSIQMMASPYEQANSILESNNEFYKKMFDSLAGSGFDKANKVIHDISSFMGLWGSGKWDLSKLFTVGDSDKSILEKIQVCGNLALSLSPTAGKIMEGGKQMLKILDLVMPYIKESKVLVKLSEKVWKLTRQDIQLPYAQKMMDQYVMEHYKIKYGITEGLSGWFVHYHDVVSKIGDNCQRRAFENAIFSAETLLIPQNYTVRENNPQKNRAICCGIFLNLVRSGLCSQQDIESGTANKIVDKLYDIYVSKEHIRPRVDIDPSPGSKA